MVINHPSRWSLYKSLAFCVDHLNRETGTANVLPKRRPRSWSVDQIVPYFGCILEALYGKILGKDKACDGMFSFKRTSPFPPFQKCQRQRMDHQRSTTIDLLSQGLGRGPVDLWQTRSSTERHSLPRALVKISFGQNIKISFAWSKYKCANKKDDLLGAYLTVARGADSAFTRDMISSSWPDYS